MISSEEFYLKLDILYCSIWLSTTQFYWGGKTEIDSMESSLTHEGYRGMLFHVERAWVEETANGALPRDEKRHGFS